MDGKHQVLQEYFGYDTFRPGQGELIDALLSGRDAFGVMPTGGGKSLCYQVPALLLPGVTVVVSPLISLMRDQVLALKKAGVGAAYLNSSLTQPQMDQVCRRLLAGEYRLLYVAPERLLADRFLSVVRQLDVAMVAVDEAHCISQWGQDFRPSYLRIVEFLRGLPRRPVVAAFTATATAQVREDIRRILELQDPLEMVTGFDRPNLRFEVLHPKNKADALLALVRDRGSRCGVVYCSTRKEVENVCRMLQEHGMSAARYHAGLPEEERRAAQEDFLYDRKTVMVATNAFGMGIDKSNVGYVIHYNMPQSLEAYYQEAGRAGRDGSDADCILLFSQGDVRTARFLLEHGEDNEALSDRERQQVEEQGRRRLNAMVGYCKTNCCLRGYILDYFGQEHQAECGNCGNCSAATVERDVTVQARMILSCVQRIRNHLGYPLGAAMVIRVLRGSGDKRVKELGLDGLTTYGLLRDTPRPQVHELMDYLEEQGCLHTDPVYGGVTLTQRAGDILFRGEPVVMVLRARPVFQSAKKAGQPEVEEDGLFSALKALRLRVAREEGVPAYLIFSNATLADMAARTPVTMDGLLQVSGVGGYKAQRYGREFLEEIRRYQEET